MKIYSDFYEVDGKEYDLKTEEGIKDLADDIFFYSKYRIGELSNEIEYGRKTVQKIIRKIVKEI